MKVVVDTNIFVSSFFRGNPRKIIDLWKHGRIILCVSKEIMDEYFEVLKRSGLEDQAELEELLSLFARGFNSLYTTKTPDLSIVPDDPCDNKFFECAVALKAEYIISGDKQILKIGEYMGIRVSNSKNMTPKIIHSFSLE